MSFWSCFASCLNYPQEELITKLDYSNCTLQQLPLADLQSHEKQLEELILSSNRIQQITPDIINFHNLRILKLNDNELEVLPSQISQLKHLTHLDLNRNGLSNLPDSIKTFKNLTYIDLSLNNLQRLPDAITNLITLQELLLNETYLEFLPVNFGRLINLKILELRSNNLITLPKSLGKLVSLQRLDIGVNEFTELPEIVGLLTQLRELWIDYNRIRRISSNIGQLNNLIHFDANNNQLQTLPNEISNWKNLQVLSVSQNEIETLPFSIGMLKNLQTLKCDHNQLKDIPESICNLEQLEELYLNNNDIIKLPNTIGLLNKNFKYLYLDENQIRRIPIELCKCEKLIILSISNNNLIEIPYEIGELINIRVINLVNNFIQILPSTILNIKKLSALWLDETQSQPLLQLHYLDTFEDKKNLSCYLLPQNQNQNELTNIIGNSTTINNSNNKTRENSNEDAIIEPGEEYRMKHIFLPAKNSQISLTDGRQNQENIQVTSPSRRICFADESQQVKTLDQTENGELQTRLMRSPTPYPKELRLMAKYCRNNIPPQPPNQIASNTTTIMQHQLLNNADESSIREVRSLSSNDQIIPNGNMNNIYQIQTQQQQQQLPQIHQQNSNYTTLSPTNFIQHQATYSAHQQQQPTNSQILAIIPPTSDIFFDPFDCHRTTTKLTSNMSVISGSDQQSQYTSRVMLQTPNGILVASSPTPIYDSNLINSGNGIVNYSSLNNDGSGQIWTDQSREYHQNIENLGHSQQQQQSSQIIQQQQLRFSQPPPYHIAKAFTKKSREDLLNYDTLRNQNILESIIVGNNENIEMVNNNISKTYNLDSNRSSISSHNGNSKIDSSEIKNESTTNNIKSSNNDETGCSVQIINNIDDDKISDLVVDEQITDLERNCNALQQQQILQQKRINQQWLFGVHKNPTVKQVLIKKDPSLGFEIKEVQNQGIFVSMTLPNTCASSLLRMNDKILDVDGNDFTKLNYSDAKKILIESGPIMNIMLSRK